MQNETLWRAFKLHNCQKSREELILAYIPLVWKCVRQVAKTVSPQVSVDDLFSYGVMGLIDAIERFDVRRATPFERYAVKRIKGAIYDGLREMGMLPKVIYGRRKRADDTENLPFVINFTDLEEAGAQHVEEILQTDFPYDGEEDLDRLLERVEWKLLIDRLPYPYSFVLKSLFFDDLSEVKTGEMLGVSYGRVSQLKKKAIEMLRARVGLKGAQSG